jgi:hypothetical protein
MPSAILTIYGTSTMGYKVSKLNKRLVIIDDDEKLVYCPPDFMRNAITTRSTLQRLCDEFNTANCRDIGCIINFESTVYSR